MQLRLTCAVCMSERLVERWTPMAMRCPVCGSETLSDGWSAREAERLKAKRQATPVRRRRAERLSAH